MTENKSFFLLFTLIAFVVLVLIASLEAIGIPVKIFLEDIYSPCLRAAKENAERIFFSLGS